MKQILEYSLIENIIFSKNKNNIEIHTIKLSKYDENGESCTAIICCKEVYLCKYQNIFSNQNSFPSYADIYVKNISMRETEEILSNENFPFFLDSNNSFKYLKCESGDLQIDVICKEIVVIEGKE